MRFILGAKPDDHKYLFDWVNSLDNIQRSVRHHFKGQKVIRKITQEIRYTNGVPLNNANGDLFVNFLEVTETIEKKIEIIAHDKNGIANITYEWAKEGKTTKFSWVTDLELEKNVYGTD